MNNTMMQTMHTMPAGIGTGIQSGYGPGSTQDPNQGLPDNNTYKTSVGFFKNQNSGSTPIGGQPGSSNMAAQALAHRQYIEKIEEQRRRHSSVVRGQMAQQQTPYGVKVQHQSNAPSTTNPDLSPMNMALRMKRSARSPDQQKAGLDQAPV